jgi:hypothetical protein
METTARADIEEAIRHHTSNLNNAVMSTGMCTFDRPTGHERRLKAGFLGIHPSHHHDGFALLRPSASSPTTVFVASDSLELKAGLHALHNGPAQALEWFNVTNAHISAISRTEAISRSAEFQLPKLMTMIEFYRICTADAVTATRLNLDTKSSESKKGWSSSGALSTFVETAAIVGGASVAICKASSFGKSGGTDKLKGDKVQTFASPTHMASAIAAAAGARAPVTVVVTVHTGKEEAAKIALEAFKVFGEDAKVVVFDLTCNESKLRSELSGPAANTEVRILSLEQNTLASEDCGAHRPLAIAAAALGLSDGTLLVWAAAPNVLSDNQWSQTENALQSLIWAPAGSLESIAVSAQDRHGLFGTTDDFSSSAADLESASPKAASTREGNATTNLLESGPFSRARHRNISSSNMHGYENEKVFFVVHDFWLFEWLSHAVLRALVWQARLQSLEGFIFMKRPGPTALVLPPQPPSFESLAREGFAFNGNLIACIVGSPAWQVGISYAVVVALFLF